MSMQLIEQAARDWRGHRTEKSLPPNICASLIETYAEELPSLPIGLPPVMLEAWSNAHNKRQYDGLIADKPQMFLKDLESIFGLLTKSGRELGIPALTLLMEVALRMRLRSIEALCILEATDDSKVMRSLLYGAGQLLDKASALRREKGRQKFMGLSPDNDSEKLGQMLLNTAWECISPRYVTFPTPPRDCPATGMHGDVVEILQKNRPLHDTTEMIWELIRSKIRPQNDEHAKDALLFTVSLYKTYVSNNLPAIVQGMFIEGSQNISIGTTHKVFVSATAKPGNENIIHCPRGFQGQTCNQVKTAVDAVLTSYLRGMETYEVAVSVDDLPGGTDPGIDIEGASLGLAVAVGLVSNLTGQTIDPDVAITGQLWIDGDTARVKDVGGVGEKVTGAEASGVTRVVVPLYNYEEAEKASRKCHLVAVDTLAALINRIWVFDAHAHHLLCEATDRRAPTPIARNMSLLDFFFTKELYCPQDVVPLKEDGTTDIVNKISLFDLLSKEDLPSQIVLFGESGLGKTSALFYLMFQATSVGQTQRQPQTVVPWYVRMRDYIEDGDRRGSICATLSSGRPNKMNFDGEDMRRTLEDLNFPPLLILLDALNELPTQKQVSAAEAVKDFCSWIKELNEKRHNHKHRVILTYRKEPHVESYVSKSLLLEKENGAEYELQRLSLQDVQTYLGRANVPTNLRDLFSPEVQDLFTVPLFAFFATELGGSPEEELKQITNKALLYKAVTRQWLRRESWDDRTKSFKLDTVFKPLTKPSLEHCVDFHARALGEIAYRMTELGLTELPEVEISKVVCDFVKKELSQKQPQEFADEGHWQWLRDYIRVLDIPHWAKEEGDGFEDFVRIVTESLLRSTVLQAI